MLMFNDSSSVIHSTKFEKIAVITRNYVFWFIGKNVESHTLDPHLNYWSTILSSEKIVKTMTVLLFNYQNTLIKTRIIKLVCSTSFL